MNISSVTNVSSTQKTWNDLNLNTQSEHMYCFALCQHKHLRADKGVIVAQNDTSLNTHYTDAGGNRRENMSCYRELPYI